MKGMTFLHGGLTMHTFSALILEVLVDKEVPDYRFPNAQKKSIKKILNIYMFKDSPQRVFRKFPI